MPNKQKKTIYALFIGADGFKADRDGGKAELRVVILDGEAIKNPAANTWPSDEAQYADLVFRCQWTEGLADGKPFAFEVEYRAPYIVDLGNAERMVHMLKRARRVEQKLPVRPETFGQWLVLMARGLGIKKLVRYIAGSGYSYSDNEHQTFELAAAQEIVDSKIAEMQKAGKEVAA